MMTSSESKTGEADAYATGISVCSWNVNNRVGRTSFRPEAAAAAMETDADVLVFNEFFPKTSLESFQQALTAGGWLHQEMSEPAAVSANRILVASRFPVSVGALPASTVDDHLTTNALCAAIGPFRLLAIRIPAYKSGQERKDAWAWLAGIAEEMERARRPSMIVGDLNTSMSVTGSRRMDAFQALLASDWTRAQPVGFGSFAKDGVWSEIDHVLATAACRITDAEYVSKTKSYELAGTPSSLSDHAALVFRAMALP